MQVLELVLQVSDAHFVGVLGLLQVGYSLVKVKTLAVTARASLVQSITEILLAISVGVVIDVETGLKLLNTTQGCCLEGISTRTDLHQLSQCLQWQLLLRRHQPRT